MPASRAIAIPLLAAAKAGRADLRAREALDDLGDRGQVLQAESRGSAHPSPGPIQFGDSERTLVISAERRSQRQQPASPEAPAPLLSEFRYGTWSRSFRFPQPIERDQLQAVYRDGLLTVTAPKAHKVSSVTVQVEG